MSVTTRSTAQPEGTPRAVPLLLFVYADPRRPTIVPLVDRPYFTIGRDAECDVVIPHDSVSRRHATLQMSPLAVLDAGSRNGTHVGRASIAPKTLVPLRPGDTFRVGSVTCRIAPGIGEIEEAAPATEGVESPAMKALDELITTVARSQLRVLVRGETGVGKDVVVRRLHARSKRSGEVLLALNCAALPETILEGELFGHERGAFTGATEARPGLFEAANRGTIFLDEIGEMPLGTQAKLLRTLEDGEVLRVGARRPIRVDVRVVAATHRDLEGMVAEKAFRQDLYYRLAGVVITVPPLRERAEEVLPLARTFLRDLQGPGEAQRFSEEAEAALLAHGWPGNIRELRNVVERASVLARGPVIGEGALGLPKGAAPARTSVPAPSSLPDELRSIERSRIEAALSACDGNQTRAASMLGMSRFALRKRIEDFGLDRGRKGG